MSAPDDRDWLGGMKVHPLADIFPMLAPDELADLAADIQANGLIYPIVRTVDGLTLVAGRNRLKACDIADVDPIFDDRIRDDAEAKAYIVSENLQRRNMTKSQQAMALAMIYPQSSPGKRTAGSATTLSETNKVSTARLSQARSILRHSPEMAQSVIAGAFSIDKALEQIAERAAEDAKPEARIAALRQRHPDIAAKVTEGIFGIDAGEAEANHRDRVEAEQREVMIRSTDQAVYNVVAFAVTDFTDAVKHRLDNPEFRKAYTERLRLGDTNHAALVERINAGADALIDILTKLREEQ